MIFQKIVSDFAKLEGFWQRFTAILWNSIHFVTSKVKSKKKKKQIPTKSNLKTVKSLQENNRMQHETNQMKFENCQIRHEINQI